MSDLNDYIAQLMIPGGIVGIVALLWAIAAISIRYGLDRQQRGVIPAGGEVSCRSNTCLMQLKRYERHLIFYKISLVAVPAVITAAYLLILHLGIGRGHIIEIVGLVAFGGILTTIFGFRLVHLIGARNLARLVHESRLETRRVLDQSLTEEYIVFHDVVSDQFSVDHLVVGPKGVFAIQTHARPLPSGTQSPHSRIVTYNGRELFFPKGSDHGIVENALQNADMLSHWLSVRANEPVAVRAIISFPGWTVRRTSSEGIPVINPTQFTSLFNHIHPWQVTATAIDQITHKLTLSMQKPEDSGSPMQAGSSTGVAEDSQ
jgi:hypothetical protein